MALIPLTLTLSTPSLAFTTDASTSSPLGAGTDPDGGIPFGTGFFSTVGSAS